ncbi:class I SAM-dependent methyltransferase [Desulfocastanea catecholica]
MSGTLRMKRYYHSLMRKAGLILNKYPFRIQCNVCGWKGRIFSSDNWHPYTICPKCLSQVRHRLLIAAISTVPNIGISTLIEGKRVLHFAPEKRLSKFFKDGAKHYVTADLHRSDVDLTLDMCNMGDVSDRSFDLIVACDVLEHVPDDSAALKQIWRVLSDKGWAILTVPQKDNLSQKFEDHSIMTPEGRKKAFGQEDHLRIYGDDFSHFLENHGFTVTIIDESSFNSNMVKQHVLFPPILSNHPLATNYRKVYFAHKVAD